MRAVLRIRDVYSESGFFSLRRVPESRGQKSTGSRAPFLYKGQRLYELSLYKRFLFVTKVLWDNLQPKNDLLSSQNYGLGCLSRIRFFPIPDPWAKKAPYPGSGSATLH